MAESAEFVTAKRKAKAITFSIDGEDYSFTPPKNAEMVLPVLEATGDQDIAAIKAQLDWLGHGLAEGESERLTARLKDPDDDFDVNNLSDILQYVLKQVAGRPTG